VDRKRPGRRGQLNVLGTGGASLVYLFDDCSKSNFLVDTGASRSVLPYSSSAFPSGPLLYAANGVRIKTWGLRELKLSFAGHQFIFSFILAAVDKPILGADFLARYKLLVDPFNGMVLFASSLQPVAAASAVKRSPLISALQQLSDSSRELLAEFPGILPVPGQHGTPLHGMTHSIETSGRPVFSKVRRLDAKKLRCAKAEFAKLEAAGIIRRSKSSWSSALHLVKKKDGTWRPCGDYRRLNLQTKHDCYPIPHIWDFTSNLSGCTVFSKIDLVKGYYQIPMAPEDVPKTAVLTPFGLYEFLFMPFGLQNAAQSFQRMMDQVFAGLPFVFVYLDDILVASASLEEHKQHLRQVFQLLKDNGLRINADKCLFFWDGVEFLGHQVDLKGVRPLQSNVEAVVNFPVPSSPKELQRYLGMVNFYRRFVPRAALLLKPLTNALVGSPRRLTWSEDMQRSFEDSKQAIVNSTSLSHPNAQSILSLATDASADHVGAVLQQLSSGSTWVPLAFFSKKLNAAQQKYSTFDRELLTVYLAVRHFHFFLEGRAFTVITDHKPLTSALHRVSPPISARQQRYLAYLSEFSLNLVHTPGSSNVVADALSRPKDQVNACVAAPQLAAVDFGEMALLQLACPDVQLMRDSPSLKTTQVEVGEQLLLGDVSTGEFRPLVPVPMRRLVFDVLHAVAHLGVRASRRLVSSRFVWPGLSSDVQKWAAECLTCQQSKIHRHVKLTPEHVPVPQRRFAHVHIDLVSPLPPSSGFNYIFTMVDRTTRWVEVAPLATITTTACASVFLHTWVARFGVPSLLTSDRGTQFTSGVWAQICQLLGVQHILSSAFHPCSNGILERWHRTFKASLRAKLVDSADWYHQLPVVMLGLRAMPREESGTSAAEAVFGSQLVLPGQLLDLPPADESLTSALKQVMAGVQPLSTVHNVPPDQLSEVLPDELLAARYVFVRKDGPSRPLDRPYEGPYEVVRRSKAVFQLRLGGRLVNISTSRLKPVISSGVLVPAEPPKRGRPRRKHVTFDLQS
jgi:RNase H-like domain found in reverse transcriptase/Reverse transcriptase (RNA-dependent DNA polymerase)/Integrase zinc binding domain/Integrase core domain